MPRMNDRPAASIAFRASRPPFWDASDQYVSGQLSDFRRMPGPRQFTAGHLSRLDDLVKDLGVQDRPHVSTDVVSTVLAADLCIPRP